MEKDNYRGVPVPTEYFVNKMAHPVNRHLYFTPLDWVIAHCHSDSLPVYVPDIDISTTPR